MTAIAKGVSMGAPPVWPGQEVLAGPDRCGSEQRWRLRLPDGRAAVLGQLLPELARDPALSRRYRRDVDRLRELALPGVAPVLAVGPTEGDSWEGQPTPPFRLREDPPGEDLEDWLSRRAPLPVEEAVALAAALCDLLGPIHARGVVLRDLHPGNIRRAEGGLVLLDIGLHRVDVLSSRTAASLLLTGSPYAAPEQLRRTALDQRADLYSVGVLLWRALTGTLPFGDSPLLLRERAPLPRLGSMRTSPARRSGAVRPGQPGRSRFGAAWRRARGAAGERGAGGEGAARRGAGDPAGLAGGRELPGLRVAAADGAAALPGLRSGGGDLSPRGPG